MTWRLFLVVAVIFAILSAWIAGKMVAPISHQSTRYTETSYGYKAVNDGSKYRL